MDTRSHCPGIHTENGDPNLLGQLNNSTDPTFPFERTGMLRQLFHIIIRIDYPSTYGKLHA
jgi:hypothetical protein